MTDYNALYGDDQPVMRSYDEPWYRAIPNALVDWIYGPNATAQQAAGVRQIAGPENPLNVPARAYQAGEQIGTGYRMGDYGMAAGGMLGLGMEALPALARRPASGGFEAVRDASMAARMRNIPEAHAWQPEHVRQDVFRDAFMTSPPPVGFVEGNIYAPRGTDPYTRGKMLESMVTARPKNQNLYNALLQQD